MLHIKAEPASLLNIKIKPDEVHLLQDNNHYQNFLASVLALAAGTGGSAAGGIALLLAYSLGLGVPFLLSGLAFGRMTDLLARV